MSVNTKINGQLVKSAGLYKTTIPIGIADIYSFEEKQVGVWTDGKPIYQCSYLTTTGISLSTQWSSAVFDKPNIDRPLKAQVLRYTGSTFNAYLVGVQHLTTGFSFNTIMSGVNCQAGSIFTVWYTKTTDVAGSGDFVPNGTPAVHYSTDEQIIGTWVNGSTLYQKTIIFEGKNKSTGSTVLISGTDLLNTYGINIDNIKKKEFLVEYYPTGYPTMTLTTDLYLDASDRAVIWSASGNLYYAIQWGSAAATMDITLTLQYTKTS